MLLSVQTPHSLVSELVQLVFVQRPVKQRLVGPVHLEDIDVGGAVVFEAAVGKASDAALVAADMGVG